MIGEASFVPRHWWFACFVFWGNSLKVAVVCTPHLLHSFIVAIMFFQYCVLFIYFLKS